MTNYHQNKNTLLLCKAKHTFTFKKNFDLYNIYTYISPYSWGFVHLTLHLLDVCFFNNT